MALDRETILAARALAKERVEVPELGGHVYVRMMNGTERDMLDDLIFTNDLKTGTEGSRLPHMRAAMACLTLCDEEGGRLFDMTEIDVLNAVIPAPALHRIFVVSRRLNGMEDGQQDEAKNALPVQNDASGSN